MTRIAEQAPTFLLLTLGAIGLVSLGLMAVVALGRSAAVGDQQLEASRVYDQEQETQRCVCGVELLMHEIYLGACDGCVAQPRIPQETRR